MQQTLAVGRVSAHGYFNAMPQIIRQGRSTGELADSIMEKLGGIDAYAATVAENYRNVGPESETHSTKILQLYDKLFVDLLKARDACDQVDERMNLDDAQVRETVRGLAIEEVRHNAEFRQSILKLILDVAPESVFEVADEIHNALLITDSRGKDAD